MDVRRFQRYCKDQIKTSDQHFFPGIPRACFFFFGGGGGGGGCGNLIPVFVVGVGNLKSYGGGFGHFKIASNLYS